MLNTVILGNSWPIAFGKGSIIYYHQGEGWNLGEHIIFGDKKGGTQKMFSPNRGNRRFSFKNSDFCPSRVLKSAQNSAF